MNRPVDRPHVAEEHDIGDAFLAENLLIEFRQLAQSSAKINGRPGPPHFVTSAKVNAVDRCSLAPEFLAQFAEKRAGQSLEEEKALCVQAHQAAAFATGFRP
jgi:hypothetical protein